MPATEIKTYCQPVRRRRLPQVEQILSDPSGGALTRYTAHLQVLVRTSSIAHALLGYCRFTQHLPMLIRHMSPDCRDPPGFLRIHSCAHGLRRSAAFAGPTRVLSGRESPRGEFKYSGSVSRLRGCIVFYRMSAAN